MPTFNVFNDLIQPLGERMQADPSFEGINIFYDRTKNKIVPREMVPAINYFWLQADDMARGSQSSSLQTRRKNISIGFGIWSYGATAAELDSRLWAMEGALEDFMRNNVDFNRQDPNRRTTICIKDTTPITSSPDYEQEANGILGTMLAVVPFELFTGAGP